LPNSHLGGGEGGGYYSMGEEKGNMGRTIMLLQPFRCFLACLVLILSVGAIGEAAQGQTKSETDPFAPLRVLEGSWEASIEGRLGTGVGIREYEFILDDKFLMSRHASVRQPQEKSSEGDHHRELSVYFTNRWKRQPKLPF
jgi:hypothetical protein